MQMEIVDQSIRCVSQEINNVIEVTRITGGYMQSYIEMMRMSTGTLRIWRRHGLQMIIL